MIRQHKRPVKRKRGEDKDEQEVGPTFMITTAAAVQEVYVVKGSIARERFKVGNKGNREKWQAADSRAKKRRYFPPHFSLGQICEKGVF